MHSIAKALLVRVEMQCISACLVKSWLFEWNPLLDGGRSCSPSKQFGNRFLGKQGFATVRGMWLCSELTHARYILCCFNEVVKWGCQCKTGLASCTSSPASWALCYEFWIIRMKVAGTERTFCDPMDGKKVMCCWNLCWCSLGGSNDSTSL